MAELDSGAECVESVIGRTIVDVILLAQVNKLVVSLAPAGDRAPALLILRDTGQSCCEHRFMTCDDDLSTFAGAKLVAVEVRDVQVRECGVAEVEEAQFLVVTTDKGAITVANHNEHNGYYGGFCISASLESI